MPFKGRNKDKQRKAYFSKKGKGFPRVFYSPEDNAYLGKVHNTREGGKVKQIYLKYLGVPTKAKVKKYGVSLPKRYIRNV